MAADDERDDDLDYFPPNTLAAEGKELYEACAALIREVVAAWVALFRGKREG